MGTIPLVVRILIRAFGFAVVTAGLVLSGKSFVGWKERGFPIESATHGDGGYSLALLIGLAIVLFGGIVFDSASAITADAPNKEERPRTAWAMGLRILGAILLVLGVMQVVDGLLPLRSHGPNPSWGEVAIGLLFTLLGWFIRKAFRR